MARSGGTYTAPSNSFNPAVEGETIDEAAWNETLDDLESALTESVYTGGLGSTDNRLVRTDGTDTKKVQGTGITVDDSNNVTGVVGLSATTIELGHASDTTLARSGAGDVTIEGNAIYRAGGTDVALADGGTGASLSDPGADRVMFWDDSAGATTWLTVGTGLAITDTTLAVSGAGTGDVIGPAESVDGEIALYDSTTGKLLKRATTTGLLKGTSGVLSAASAGTDYYAPSGTDVALADGGTGASLSDPNADRIMFWDDSAGEVTWLEVGAGISISGTTITVSGAGTGDVVGPASSVDGEIALFDSTTGKIIKRASTTGVLKATSGVLAAAVSGTDYAPATSGASVLKGNGSGGTTAAAATDLGAGKHTIWIPAVAMTPRVTNGPSLGVTELATNDVMLSTLDFDTTTEEGAGFWIAMPKSWDESTVTFKPLWTAASGSGGVVWGLAGYSFSDDDAMDQAVSGQQTSTDTLLTANDMHIGPESSAITIGGTPAEGDAVYFEITREVANGSDTIGADAKLIGIHLYITTNAITDA